jgi:hypothetical protein
MGEGADSTPTGPPRSSDGSGIGSQSSGSGFTPVNHHHTSNDSTEELKRLKRQLDERDKQLKEQASSLAEMESSLYELQNLLPMDGMPHHDRTRSGGVPEDADAAQLRAIIREKNEKISMLISEFDNHRADFRSTLDTLEIASTETERVYEKKLEELMQEVRDFQERGEDVDNVAKQLKQLEDLVQELEEGLEDARRGEADARSEVEFLKGEVERTRAELKREREKAAAATTATTAATAATAKKMTEGPFNKTNGHHQGNQANRDSRDIEQRDDEIRGLKAIIHSLSSGPDLSDSTPRAGLSRNSSFPSPDPEEFNRLQTNVDRLEREKKELQGLVERKAFREEELERELGQFQRSSIISNPFSDRTATQEKRSSARDSKGTVLSWRGNSHIKGEVKPPLSSFAEAESVSSTAGSTSAALWCEICENAGHDILTCPNIDSKESDSKVEVVDKATTPKAAHFKTVSISSQDPDKPKPLTMLNKKPSMPSLKKKLSLPPPPGAAPTGPLPMPNVSPAPAVSAPPPINASLDSLVAGKDGSKDANKWCAICEHDGHDSINCSMDDEF